MDNISRAKQLYEEAVKLDFLNKFREGIYASEIGLAPLTHPAGHKGYQLMQEAADLGYAQAQYQLGLYHWFETYHRDAMCTQTKDSPEYYDALLKLKEQDRIIALSQLEHAAQQNHGEACLLLGDIYSEHFFCGGLSQRADNNKAFMYYKKGAEAGCVDAMYRLGRCYYHGFGTAENDNAAFIWFSKARDAGCKQVYVQLGECYMNGYGTAKDIPKAIQAFESALREKDTGFKEHAKCKLALIYQGCDGFRYADFAKAREYANSVSPDSDAYSMAQKILADMPEAEAEYRKWKAANTSSSSSGGSSGGCYVATAVYGSYDCPQVWTLRRFRDFTLAETWYGRAFIRTYYAISPTLVRWFGHTAWFKALWKGPLDRMVQQLQKDGVESTPYQDQVW